MTHYFIHERSPTDYLIGKFDENKAERVDWYSIRSPHRDPASMNCNCMGSSRAAGGMCKHKWMLLKWLLQTDKEQVYYDDTDEQFHKHPFRLPNFDKPRQLEKEISNVVNAYTTLPKPKYDIQPRSGKVHVLSSSKRHKGAHPRVGRGKSTRH